MSQKDKLFSYLIIRGYDKKWAVIYRNIREELIDMGVEDASSVSRMTARLMSLRSKIQDLFQKIRQEMKLFNYDGEDESIDLFIEFTKEMGEEIDRELPLKGEPT